MVKLVYVCIWWDWYVVKQIRSYVTNVLCYGYNIMHAFEFYFLFYEKKTDFLTCLPIPHIFGDIAVLAILSPVLESCQSWLPIDGRLDVYNILAAFLTK